MPLPLARSPCPLVALLPAGLPSPYSASGVNNSVPTDLASLRSEVTCGAAFPGKAGSNADLRTWSRCLWAFCSPFHPVRLPGAGWRSKVAFWTLDAAALGGDPSIAPEAFCLASVPSPRTSGSSVFSACLGAFKGVIARVGQALPTPDLNPLMFLPWPRKL